MFYYQLKPSTQRVQEIAKLTCSNVAQIDLQNLNTFHINMSRSYYISLTYFVVYFIPNVNNVQTQRNLQFHMT